MIQCPFCGSFKVVLSNVGKRTSQQNKIIGKRIDTAASIIFKMNTNSGGILKEEYICNRCLKTFSYSNLYGYSIEFEKDLKTSILQILWDCIDGKLELDDHFYPIYEKDRKKIMLKVYEQYNIKLTDYDLIYKYSGDIVTVKDFIKDLESRIIRKETYVCKYNDLYYEQKILDIISSSISKRVQLKTTCEQAGLQGAKSVWKYLKISYFIDSELHIQINLITLYQFNNIGELVNYIKSRINI